jgi:hypothetical protein
MMLSIKVVVVFWQEEKIGKRNSDMLYFPPTNDYLYEARGEEGAFRVTSTGTPAEDREEAGEKEKKKKKERTPTK